jgi:hypothetical protein
MAQGCGSQGCGCGCGGQTKATRPQMRGTPTGTRALMQTSGIGRVRGGLRQTGAPGFEQQEPWLAVGPKGVSVVGREFGWQAVGGFVMQGALLYLLWTTIRKGPEAVQTERERQAAS